MKKVTVQYNVDYESDKDYLQSYLLEVVAISSNEMPKEIFVFQRGIKRPDQFIKVATAIDLEEYPTDAPDLDNEIPYYRSASVRLIFESKEILEDTIKFISQDIKELVKALNQEESDTLRTLKEVTYDGSTPIDFY